MRIDFGLILALTLECIFFIYYADTLFYRKRNKLLCYTMIAVEYAVHFIVCMFGNVILNISMFFILNFIAFILLYHITYKNAASQSAILTVISTASELLVVYAMKINMIDVVSMTPYQSILLTVSGKLLYLMGIIVTMHIFISKGKTTNIYSTGLALIPMLTMIILLSLIKMAINNNLIILVCILLVIINLIVFSLNQNLLIMGSITDNLQKESIKEKIDFEEYTTLKDKYERMRIFHHDFKKHINALNSLIYDDNDKAKEYIKNLCSEEYSSQYIDYTDNKMLNIILSKKRSECDKYNIKFVIEPIMSSLEFFNDMDTVSIFSNLIDNAIESSRASSEKKIFFNAYTVNENFIVVKVENSSDKKPFVIEGKLRTHKDNAELHGIGVNSIKRALNNYNGVFNWKYDKEQRIFCTTITVQK